MSFSNLVVAAPLLTVFLVTAKSNTGADRIKNEVVTNHVVVASDSDSCIVLT